MQASATIGVRVRDHVGIATAGTGIAVVVAGRVEIGDPRKVLPGKPGLDTRTGCRSLSLGNRFLRRTNRGLLTAQEDSGKDACQTDEKEHRIVISLSSPSACHKLGLFIGTDPEFLR